MPTFDPTFHKVVALPANPNSDSVYFIRDGDKVKAVVTGHDGTPRSVFDKDLVDQRISQLVGSSAPTSFPASIPISGHCGVIINALGEVAYADASNPAHVNRLIGLSLNAANAGGLVSVAWSGEVDEPSWNWTPDQNVYLAAGGTLTTNPTGLAFTQRIGYAMSPTKLFLKISDAILVS